MPTGYTHNVRELTFEQFALQCARAFGALVTMRDEPGDTPIPERLEPDDYYQKEAERVSADLAKLDAMSESEQRALMDAEHAAHERHTKEYNAKNEQQLSVYESMLAKVQAWEPPTPDHTQLKGFMVEQLEKSIKFDCSYTAPKAARPDFDVWLTKKRATLNARLARAQESYLKEVERTEARNKWLSALRESLRATA